MSATAIIHGLESIGDSSDFDYSNIIQLFVYDNLIYYFSSINPLNFCGQPPYCLVQVAQGTNWDDDDNAASMSDQFEVEFGTAQVYNMSGGDTPTWKICKGPASGSPCLCNYEGAPWESEILPVPYEGRPHDWLSGYRPCPYDCTPVDYSERVELTEETDPPPPQYFDPFTVRYNCHGLTFFNASFEQPKWYNMAEPQISPCGPYRELALIETRQPGDVLVWFDHKPDERPGLSIHSATMVGPWAGNSTLMKSKNGARAQYNPVELSYIEGIYGSELTPGIEIKAYRYDP